MVPEERDRLTRVETKVEQIEQDLSELKDTASKIHDLLSQAKGAWRVMLALGAAGATVGALGLKLIDKVWP